MKTKEYAKQIFVNFDNTELDGSWRRSGNTSTSAKKLGDIRQWTGNRPACQYISSSGFYIPAQINLTISILKTQNIGLFLPIESCWILQQYFYGVSKVVRIKAAICSQRCIQTELEQKETQPHYSCSGDQLHWLPIRQCIDFKTAMIFVPFIVYLFIKSQVTYRTCSQSKYRF